MLTCQQKGIVRLVRGALTGEPVTLPEGFDTDKLCGIAKRHHAMNILLYGAIAAGLEEGLPIMRKLYVGAGRELVLGVNQTAQISQLCSAFEENGIDYMPLKGILLKALYPKPEMRVMSDADILIRTEQYERIKPIVQQLGFTEVVESDHEFVWDKPGMLHLELHKSLLPSYNTDYYEYFGDGWKLAKQSRTGGYRYELSDEDAFLYLFTHFAKHYRDGGIGIKHFADLWVFRHAKSGLDYPYIEQELKKLRLYDFYRNILRTLAVWFEDGVPDEKTDLITDVILKSGAYGTHEAHVYSAAVRASAGAAGQPKNAKSTLLKAKLFPSLSAMRVYYKYLERAPFLLPAAWLSRWVDALLHKRERLRQHRSDIRSVTDEKTLAYEKSLHDVGLDFHFKEQDE